MKKVVIIGGGPAGLTAAYEFIKTTDITPIVLEKSNYWGGISRTVNYKNNRIDIGGHRFFSKSDEVMNWWVSILPILPEEDLKSTNSEFDKENEDVFLVRNRKSRIFFLKKFFKYPISLEPETLQNLGLLRTFKIGVSYLKANLFPIKKEKNLEDFFINRFGKELYNTFFKDYTEKVWGVKCSDISPEWGAQRIKGLSITKAILHFFKQKKNIDKDIKQKNIETSLIEYFLYPKYGPGQMWEKVAEIVENKNAILKQNSIVNKIHFSNKKISSITYLNTTTNTEEVIQAEYFISTMPIKELINAFDIEVPSKIKTIANGLQYRDFITVGLLLDRMLIENIQDNWIYIQESYVKVGRIQFFNNWSPFLVEDPTKIWIGLEYFCDEGDELWNLSEDEMKQLAIEEMIKMNMIKAEFVKDSVVIKIEKAYPAYFGTYNEIKILIDYVSQFENLFLIGRNGMHKYNNQDHSMLTAIKTVENIKNNIFTKENIWNINTEQNYHEEKSN